MQAWSQFYWTNLASISLIKLLEVHVFGLTVMETQNFSSSHRLFTTALAQPRSDYQNGLNVALAFVGHLSKFWWQIRFLVCLMDV